MYQDCLFPVVGVVEPLKGRASVSEEGKIQVAVRITLGKEVIRPLAELLAENSYASVYVLR